MKVKAMVWALLLIAMVALFMIGQGARDTRVIQLEQDRAQHEAERDSLLRIVDLLHADVSRLTQQNDSFQTQIETHYATLTELKAHRDESLHTLAAATADELTGFFATYRAVHHHGQQGYPVLLDTAAGEDHRH